MGAGLFGFNSNGSSDTSRELMPTPNGYREAEESLKRVKPGRINKDDPTVKRLALLHGKTVEDYLKYEYGQW